MLRARATVKKSRSGNVFKSVQEHYLRKEIPCGIRSCRSCSLFPNVEILNSECDSASSLYPNSHCLVPEAGVFLKQIDLFENDKITNVIILQSVLNQVKSCSTGVYDRLKNLSKILEKCFYIFQNEYQVDTFCTQKCDESTRSWQQRMNCLACQWYLAHIKEEFTTPFDVVLMVDDVNSIAAYVSDVQCCTVIDYVRSLSWSEELIDSVVLEENDTTASSWASLSSPISFPEHIPINIINVGLKSGKYFSGVFYQSPENYLCGVVKVKSISEDIHVCGLIHMNRAFTDDIVAIELIYAPSINGENTASDLLCHDNGDCFSIPQYSSGVSSTPPDQQEVTDKKENEENMVGEQGTLKYGKVIGIIRRNWKQYCGQLLRPTPAPNVYLFKAMDDRLPLIMFESKRAQSLASQKLCISVDVWSPNFRYPKGHFVRSLGEVGDKGVQTDAILFECGIAFQKFSKSVLNCLPDLHSEHASLPNLPEWRVEKVLEAEPYRVDLRHLCVCSIDPPGCTDIDDALHCRVINITGSSPVYEIGIHIADVTHYVIPGTALDQEAYRRGTTVYLVDRRIDMLPEVLSSNLCSLRPNQDRLAFSVLCYVDSTGSLLSDRPPVFVRTVINSKHAYTYAEAQCIIDDANDKSEVGLMLKRLCLITKQIHKCRIDRGALFLSSAEVGFEIDCGTLEPLELHTKESLETNKMIEDCMLLANILVAKKIYASFNNLALLRCHPHPSHDNLRKLMKLVKQRLGNFVLDDENISLASFLKSITSGQDPCITRLVHKMCIRCLSPASYLCAGCHPYSHYFHYGLAEEMYTHFTSPIRRYPDIVVHRMLTAAIVATESNIISCYDSLIVQRMCDYLNRRHTSAQIASRESIKLHLLYYIKSQHGGCKEEPAYITKVLENAILLHIPAFNREAALKINKKVHIDQDGGAPVVSDEAMDYFFDQGDHCIRFHDTAGTTLRTFDRVLIQLRSTPQQLGASLQASSLSYFLVEPVIPGLSVPSFANSHRTAPCKVSKLTS